MSHSPSEKETTLPSNFIRNLILEDIAAHKNNGRVGTRFPPEPNGYLHIGHAKAICLNFELAAEFMGICNLRMDDTNPCKEETEFVSSIQEDVRWLGFDWGDRLFFASDYFEELYRYALELVKMDKAYVDDLTLEEIREYRGTLTEPGKESPYRNRSVEENIDLFQKMRQGVFADGEKVLRAKIDMASPNVIMRDPVLYRIRRAHHHRTSDTWCIYPMYDFAHCLSDSLERITHSLCTLEFENNRELYDWVLDTLGVFRSYQYEFARLNLSYTVLSKRKLIELVDHNFVSGWDDPRMPTLSGYRRRGVPPGAIRTFCERIGVAKRGSMVDVALLDFCIREELNKTAARAMGVLKPVKVVITNYPENQTEEMMAQNHPENPSAGTRRVPFSKELYIEQDDFMECAPKQFYRLTPGREVRLRYAYYVTCTDVIKDADGNIIEIHCTYDPETKGGTAPDGRKVKSTLHWVSAKHAIDATVRMYSPLFTLENPNDVPEEKSYLDFISPTSLEVIENCKLEPHLAQAKIQAPYQFERLGYFCLDPDTKKGKRIFNQTVPLRDAWTKQKG